ncbi:MAG: zinc ribbon domain-containing protein, partial [Lachnospiraceae bacterium]
ILCWTVIVPIAAGIFYAVLWVVKIICFVSICKGEAKEPVIIRSFTFLK